MWRVAFVPLGVVFAGGACTAVVDANVEQCLADRDCEGRGFSGMKCVQRVCVAPLAAQDSPDAGADAPPVDPKWGCLGNVSWAMQDSSTTVNYRRRFSRLVGDTGVAQLEVKACGRADVDCVSPLGTATTDPNGFINIGVPKNFEGYLSMTKPPLGFESMMPSMSYSFPPVDADMPRDAPIRSVAADVDFLVGADELGRLSKVIGNGALDPTRGHLLGSFLDCQGKPASGVTAQITARDGTTIQYYTDMSGLYSASATETLRGGGGFLNVLPGTVRIETTVNALGKRGGSITVLVKAGYPTYFRMSPTP